MHRSVPAPDQSAAQSVASPAQPPGQLAHRPTANPLAPVTPGPGVFSQTYQSASTQPSPYRTVQDGWRIVNRDGWLTYQPGGGWLFHYQQIPNETSPPMPMQLLPNEFRSEMEDRVMKRLPRQTWFRVSGEVTLYRGKDYLMVQKATELDEPPSSQPAESAAER